jgi:hypothetical protein
MNNSFKFLGSAALIVAGLALTSPIFAADTSHSPDSNMGTGMTEHGGMMNMMNMMNMMQQMNQMMESCNKMMQSTPGSGKPTEQKEMPAQPDKKG